MVGGRKTFTLIRVHLPSMYSLYQSLAVFLLKFFSPDVSVQQVNKGMRMIATLANMAVLPETLE